MANYFGERSVRRLQSSTEILVRELQLIMERSRSQEDSQQWWVLFSNPVGSGNDLYYICSGASYIGPGPWATCVAAGGSEFKRTSLGTDLDFISPVSGTTKEVVFAKSTGNLPTITGTVTVANGSTMVNGSGTSFLSQFAPGEYIMVNGVATQIATVNSNILITLASAFTGTCSSNCSGLLSYKQVRVTINSTAGAGSKTITVNPNGSINY